MSGRVFNQARARKVGSGLLVFAEFELYNDINVNIAPLGTATATSSGWGGQPEYAIDGSSDNTIASCHHSTGSSNETWTLTMDRPYAQSELSSVGFLGRNIGSNHDSVAIELLSADGQPPLVLGTTQNVPYQTFAVPAVLNSDFLVSTPGVSSITSTVVEVPGANTYQINITESTTGTTRVAHSGISTGEFTIRSLTPETMYVLDLYANTGSGYQLEFTENVTTLAHTANNYDTSEFGDNGQFDLSTLNSLDLALLVDVINDVFTTGDKIDIKIGSTKSRVSFVKRGDTVSTDESILVPFDENSGTDQTFTMELSDNSTVHVSYDETANTLNIGGQVVNTGESIVVDGKKVTVKQLQIYS